MTREQWVTLAGVVVIALGWSTAELWTRPPTVDAATMCTTLLRAACERQKACPSCPDPAMPCSAVVADELAPCAARAGEQRFSGEAVSSCERAMLGQPCPSSCEALTEPDACAPFTR
jgi:hypothetical protein